MELYGQPMRFNGHDGKGTKDLPPTWVLSATLVRCVSGSCVS